MPNLQRVDEVVAGLFRRDEQLRELEQSFERRADEVYLSAKRLGVFLGYKDHKTFMGCVAKAQITAAHTNRSIQYHFASPELFDAEQDDVWLTPWAAFATIIEADNSKPKVAAAKSYFAALVDEETALGEARLKERSLFKRIHRELHGAAEKAGVVSGVDHAMFEDYGYLGMYGMGIRQVEQYKRVPDGQRLIDCAGSTEIAANNLRMSMTKDSLDKGDAKSKVDANKLHRRNGSIVRDAVTKGTGMPPECLPLEDKTLDQVSLEKKKELKALGH